MESKLKPFSKKGNRKRNLPRFGTRKLVPEPVPIILMGTGTRTRTVREAGLAPVPSMVLVQKSNKGIIVSQYEVPMAVLVTIVPMLMYGAFK